jgi:hypothetical protein
LTCEDLEGPRSVLREDVSITRALPTPSGDRLKVRVIGRVSKVM